MTRRILPIAALVGITVLLPAIVTAGLPDPTRSSVGLSDPQTDCHYRFSHATGEVLTVWVTARDPFDTPYPGCLTTVGLTSPGSSFSDCCGVQSGITDAGGMAEFTFTGIGGRGTLHVNVTLFCASVFPLIPVVVEFTSTNLDGDPSGVTNVIDAAIFAGSLGAAFPLVPPHLWANYNCDGAVNILDASYLAGALGLDCGATVCP